MFTIRSKVCALGTWNGTERQKSLIQLKRLVFCLVQYKLQYLLRASSSILQIPVETHWVQQHFVSFRFCLQSKPHIATPFVLYCSWMDTLPTFKKDYKMTFTRIFWVDVLICLFVFTFFDYLYLNRHAAHTCTALLHTGCVHIQGCKTELPVVSLHWTNSEQASCKQLHA